jgi:type I restriction enzyme S subunit
MTRIRKLKQTEIGAIPEEWSFEPLIKHAEIIMGQSPESKFYNNTGEGIVFLQGIRTFGEKYPTYDTYTTKITKKAKEGSVLLSVRAPVGEVNIATKDACIGRGLMAINSKNNEFIYQLLKAFKPYLVGKETGTVYGSVTKNDIAELKLPFPPQSEQLKIAEILSSLDDKIELNRHINANLEAVASALFKKWFVDIGDELPEGWRYSTIGKEVETFLGGTPSRDKKEYWVNGTIPWINSGKINDFRITRPSEYITKNALHNSATKLLPKGTVVIAITGATLGKYSLLEIDSSFNQSVVGIKENDIFKKEFLYFWIANTIKELINAQTGGAQQHINKQVIDDHKLLVPNNKTLNKFYKISTTAFNMISKNCFEIENLIQIRDVLLPRLMCGKIKIHI